MALVVSVAASATNTNCATVPVAVVVGAALKKPLIATETNRVAPDTVAVATAHFWR